MVLGEIWWENDEWIYLTQDKEEVYSENTDEFSCNIRRGEFLEYLRMFWFPKEVSHVVR
jgi:hypothetical protein